MVLKEEIRASDIKKNGFNETSFFLFACCCGDYYVPVQQKHNNIVMEDGCSL